MSSAFNQGNVGGPLLSADLFLFCRLVSERGSSRLLDHVEQIDKLHDIPPPSGVRDTSERAVDVFPLPTTPKLR